jgi:hypothetical protein
MNERCTFAQRSELLVAFLNGHTVQIFNIKVKNTSRTKKLELIKRKLPIAHFYFDEQHPVQPKACMGDVRSDSSLYSIIHKQPSLQLQIRFGFGTPQRSSVGPI